MVGGSTPEISSGTVRRAPFARWLAPKLFPIVLILVMTALVTILLWQRIFVSVKPGEAGVLYRLFTGTEVERVYRPGLHVIPPWNTMIHYETRKQLVMYSFDVLSVRGLPVHLELAIRYQPEYEQLGILHQRIGPDYVNRVVTPQTQSVMRRDLSQYTAVQIYTNAGGLLNEAIVLAREEVGRNYVVAEDIVIRTISLPASVKQAIEDKLTQRELLQSYVFRLQTAEEEAERKRNAARGIRDYQSRVDATLSNRLLEHAGIKATKQLAVSKNARVIVIGGDDNGLPLVPGGR